MILLDDVVKYYPGDKEPALKHVSLHIQPKEFVFLVGQSGAGKSTLIKMLTREEVPTSGRIMVGGIDYEYMKRRHIPHLRYLVFVSEKEHFVHFIAHAGNDIVQRLRG